MDSFKKRQAMFLYGAKILSLGYFGIAMDMPTQSNSRHALTRGGRRKCLPGGMRGMSQRQRRKRIRQGVI